MADSHSLVSQISTVGGGLLVTKRLNDSFSPGLISSEPASDRPKMKEEKDSLTGTLIIHTAGQVMSPLQMSVLGLGDTRKSLHELTQKSLKALPHAKTTEY